MHVESRKEHYAVFRLTLRQPDGTALVVAPGLGVRLGVDVLHISAIRDGFFMARRAVVCGGERVVSLSTTSVMLPIKKLVSAKPIRLVREGW